MTGRACAGEPLTQRRLRLCSGSRPRDLDFAADVAAVRLLSTLAYIRPELNCVSLAGLVLAAACVEGGCDLPVVAMCVSERFTSCICVPPRAYVVAVDAHAPRIRTATNYNCALLTAGNASAPGCPGISAAPPLPRGLG